MTYEEITQKRAQLVANITALVEELDDMQSEYDALVVAKIKETGANEYMTAPQIALYTGLTIGRVKNVMAQGKLAFIKEDQRMSLRSDVDAMMAGRWKRA